MIWSLITSCETRTQNLDACRSITLWHQACLEDEASILCPRASIITHVLSNAILDECLLAKRNGHGVVLFAGHWLIGFCVLTEHPAQTAKETVKNIDQNPNREYGQVQFILT